MSARRSWLGLLLCTTGPGCYTGFHGDPTAIDDPDGSRPGDDGQAEDDGDSGDDDDDAPQAGCDASLAVGASSLLRLTQQQYANALSDLLGLEDVAEALAADLPADEKLGPFTLNAATTPSLLADASLRTAEAAADAFVARMDTNLPCSAAANRACAQSLLEGVGPRAFRRPLTDAEREDLLAAFDGAPDFPEGIRRLVAAMLVSPSFLYRVELGTDDPRPGEVFALTAYEVAARLSFSLWSSVPDAELMAAADSGALLTSDGRRAQAERLLADPRARGAVLRFHREWLGIDTLLQRERDPALYPEYDQALAQSMADETDAFVGHVVFDGDGTLATLLDASYTIADDRMLALYGVASTPGRDPTLPVELPLDQRAGVLTHASFLTATAHRDQASPILRGIAVRTHVLCQGLPPPPPGVDDEPPDVDPDATTRERFEQHTADPTCATCHELIDPIGFGLSNYDAIGRYVETENGQPIDGSGEITSVADIDGPFVGAELGPTLAESETVKRCYAEQWFSYAHGRTAAPGDECELEQSYRAFAEQGLDIVALIVATVSSPAFAHRSIAEPTAPDPANGQGMED